MYLTATHPNLMFIVSLISRYMKCLTKSHLLAAKRVLRYVKGTVSFGIFYKKEVKSSLNTRTTIMLVIKTTEKAPKVMFF